jgi:hypothetical protein
VATLRWIAVLPGAFAAFVLTQAIVLIGSLLTPLDVLLELWGAFVCPINALYAAIALAPKFKFAVALSTTALMTAITFMIVCSVLIGAYVPGDVNKCWFLFRCGAGVIVPICMCVFAALARMPEAY